MVIAHVSNNGVHAVVETLHIDSDKAVEILFRGTLNRADVGDSGVVDKDVNLLVLKKVGERRLHLALAGYVTNVSGSFSAYRKNLLTSGSGGALVDVEDVYCRSLLGETQSDGLPNTAASAGNNSDFAV